MKKQTLGIIIILLVAGGLVVLAQRDSQKAQTEALATDTASTTDMAATSDEPASTDTQPTTETASSDITPTEPTMPTFTLAEVAQHNNDADCYAAINGYVYDLTAWIDQHPGGDRNILRICGTDGSDAYNQQHGRNREAQNILAGFEVGTLAE